MIAAALPPPPPSASERPKSLSCHRYRLREYFHKSRHVQVAIANNALLLKMSPTLQGETLWRVNHMWLRRVRFLIGTQPEFIGKVMLSLSPLVFAPSENIFGNQLYILHHGMVVYGGKVLGAGGVWGEDMLIYYQSLRKRDFAKAISYAEAFSIDRERLFAVSEHFAASHRKIRGYIGWLAFRRMVVVIGKREMLARIQLGNLHKRSPYLESVFALVYQEAEVNVADPFAQFAATGSEAFSMDSTKFTAAQEEAEGLKITAVSASGLLAADSNGLSDPYATLKLFKKKQKTSTLKKTLTPAWEQSFEWMGERGELRRERLDIKIFDWDRLSRDDLIGSATVLLDFLPDRPAEREVALSPQGVMKLRFEWLVESPSVEARQPPSHASPPPPPPPPSAQPPSLSEPLAAPGPFSRPLVTLAPSTAAALSPYARSPTEAPPEADGKSTDEETAPKPEFSRSSPFSDRRHQRPPAVASAPSAVTTPTRAGNDSWTAAWMQNFSADQQSATTAAATTVEAAAVTAVEQVAAEQAVRDAEAAAASSDTSSEGHKGGDGDAQHWAASLPPKPGPPPLPAGKPPLPTSKPPLLTNKPPLPVGTPPLPGGAPPLLPGGAPPPLPGSTPPLPGGAPPPPEGSATVGVKKNSKERLAELSLSRKQLRLGEQREQRLMLEHHAASLEQRAARLETQASRIEQQATDLDKRAARMDAQAAKLDEQAAVLNGAIAHLNDLQSGVVASMTGAIGRLGAVADTLLERGVGHAADSALSA